MHERFAPAKLLLAFVCEGCGRAVVDFSKQGGARGGTKLSGRGLDMNSASMEYRAQDIVLTLMWDEAENVINAVLDGVAGHSDPITGVILILDAPKTLTRTPCAPGQAEGSSSGNLGEDMKSDHMMIVSITNHGEAEALMEAAREAGARGGTILHGMGTGTADDIKYFGISLAPEKELLVVISDAAHADAILETLGNQPIFSEPGGGIIFTANVAKFITMGNKPAGL